MRRSIKVGGAIIFLYSSIFSVLEWTNSSSWKTTTFLILAASYQLIALAMERFVVNLPPKSKFLSRVRANDEKDLVNHGTIAGGNFKSFIHATISGLGAAYLLKTEQQINHDRMFGTSWQIQLVAINSAAYFYGDLFDLLLLYSKPLAITDRISIVHHIIGLFAFVMTATGIGSFYGVSILLFEASTPFVAVRWFLIQAGILGPLLSFVEYLFVTLFIVVRFGYGWFYLSPAVIKDLWPIAKHKVIDKDIFPMYDVATSPDLVFIARCALISLILATTINVLFFIKIIDMLRRKYKRLPMDEVVPLPNDEVTPSPKGNLRRRNVAANNNPVD